MKSLSSNDLTAEDTLIGETSPHIWHYYHVRMMINFTIENLADTLEAILIEGLEPRQNRQTGKNFGFEFIQAPDREMEKDKLKAKLFKELLK